VGPGAPVRSLAELAAWNRDHEQAALKFGQRHVETALAVDHPAEQAAYRAARARDLVAATEALEGALSGRAEAIVFPGIEGSSLAARAGWPSVVLPAGYSAGHRRPFGVLLVARLWEDARLLELADALERVLPARRAPWEVNPAAFGRFAGR
jgi:amidase